jgi:hypothetical protein
MTLARWSVLALVLSIGAFAFACGGSGGGKKPGGDADVLRDQAVAAMNALDSYSVEMDLGQGEPFVIEYKSPNSYRTKLVANDDQTGKRTLGEVLYVADTIYARKCDPDGSSCGDWDTTTRGDVIVGAASPSYFPQWPVVALEMADDVSISGDTISGSVNHIRAVFENNKRLLPPGAGSGEKCTAGSAPVREGVTATPAPTIEGKSSCHQMSEAEALEGQEPGLSFYDEHPARLEVEVDPQTHRVASVKVTIIVENDDASSPQSVTTRSFTFTYSKYNAVTIEAPQ